MLNITRERIIETATARLISNETFGKHKDLVSNKILDLREVYYMPAKELGSDSYIGITKDLINHFDIGKGELTFAARCNALNKKFEISGLMATMFKLMGNDAPVPDEPPYCVTADGFYDAVVLEDIATLRKVYEKIGGEYYILPSSVHEILCLPAEDQDVEDLGAMVKGINRSEVAPDERLSDNVYKFDGTRVTIA